MKETVMRVLVVIVMFVVVVAFSTPLLAGDDDIPLVPLVDPIPFEDLDLNGIWNFETTQPTVSGVCPAGTAMAGTAAITQNGNAVTLKYISGAKCKPAAVCSYDGTLDEEGNQFVVANSVTVDSEGGTVSSAIRLTVYNNEYASGNGTNHYVHPKGFECRWNMDVVFTRELGDDED
jgi:hypothetical protein